MSAIHNLCVYCGSGPGTNPAYAATAEALGRLLAVEGIRLIYGGGSLGLMGIVARSVLRHDGQVTGIIPEFLKSREKMLHDVSDLIITTDMHERKKLMFERSDAFVALPGGIGTLEETVEMLTWAQLGQHDKPILLANIEGFWNPMISLLEHMRQEEFIREGLMAHYLVADKVEDILPSLKQAVKDGWPRAQDAGAPSLNNL